MRELLGELRVRFELLALSLHSLQRGLHDLRGQNRGGANRHGLPIVDLRHDLVFLLHFLRSRALFFAVLIVVTLNHTLVFVVVFIVVVEGVLGLLCGRLRCSKVRLDAAVW